MVTCLTLGCQFFQLQKLGGLMQTSIMEVQCMAFQLKEIACKVSNKGIILVLTGGLLQSYENFITTLDAINPENLTVTYVITHIKEA